MSFETYLRDLARLLDERSRVAWARASGEGSPELTSAVAERVADLTSDDALRELTVGAAAAPSGDVRWWRLAAAEEEALIFRCRELAAEIDDRVARAAPAAVGTELLQAPEVRLARTPAAAARDRLGGALREVCAERTTGLDELAECRRRRLRFPGDESARELARGRSAERTRELAAEILDRTDEEFARACAEGRRLAGGRGGVPGAWVDLPRFLTGGAVARSVPSADAGMLRFVLGRLGLERSLGGRLRLVHGRPPSLGPRAGVYVLSPGRRVIAAWTDMGPMRDYRGLLAIAGRALPWALLEDRRSPGGRYRDPAISHLFGALLEGLAGSDPWLETALRGTVPAGWRAMARLHWWLRVRQLAAQVLGPWNDADAELPARVPGSDLERATGFLHPDGVSPWTDAPSAAGDELVGRLAAVVLEDALAARHGRMWTVPAAGRFLRELWATGQHGCLDALLADLDLGEISPEPALQLRRPILGRA